MQVDRSERTNAFPEHYLWAGLRQLVDHRVDPAPAGANEEDFNLKFCRTVSLRNGEIAFGIQEGGGSRSSTDGLPDENLRVLLAQVTTDGLQAVWTLFSRGDPFDEQLATRVWSRCPGYCA